MAASGAPSSAAGGKAAAAPTQGGGGGTPASSPRRSGASTPAGSTNGIPVLLHVYDLNVEGFEYSDQANRTILKSNAFMRDVLGFGGAFHAAVEIFGSEYSFGYCPFGSGVFACEPRKNECYSFREVRTRAARRRPLASAAGIY